MALKTETLEFLQKIEKENPELFSDLKPREKDILKLRYGLGESKKKSLQEIGNLFGVKGERIRQIEANAIRKLKGYINLIKTNPLKLENIRKYRLSDARVWNALRSAEGYGNRFTMQQLQDKEFLSNIRNLGEKSIKKILENPELYCLDKTKGQE